MKYTDIETKKMWNESESFTVKELLDEVGRLLDDTFNFVQNEVVYQRLRQKLGLDYKLPNTMSKKEWIDCGYSINKIVPATEDTKYICLKCTYRTNDINLMWKHSTNQNHCMVSNGVKHR